MFRISITCLLLFSGIFACAQSPGPFYAEIMEYARLQAEHTRCESPFPWPHEDRDGPAGLRDDTPQSAWRPGGGLEVSLTLDLQPFTSEPMALESLAIEYLGNPGAVNISLAPSCATSEKQDTLNWSNPKQPLAFFGKPAGCITLCFQPEDDFALTAISASSALKSAPPFAGLTYLPPQIIFPKSGVIEGFYGPSWSWREREMMLQLLAKLGLGYYLYAPKSDPLHRQRWREPYSEQEMQHFSQLAQLGDRLGVRFALGISPFVDFDFKNQADFLVLKEKLEQFYQVGISDFVILADDIEDYTGPVDELMGLDQLAVLNRLLADLGPKSEVTLGFVPTVYSEERRISWPGGNEYLEALSGLDEKIYVFWTGARTSGATLSAEEFATVKQMLRRKPIVWDNFYANDGGDGLFGRILLAPYSGRKKDLLEATAGICLNPSMQGALARLQAAMLAAFLSEPDKENLSARRQFAAESESLLYSWHEEHSGDDKEILVFLQEVFDGHCERDVAFEALEKAAAMLLTEIEQGKPSPVTVHSLLRLFARLSLLESQLHHSGLDVHLVDELIFPLEKARLLGEGGIYALQALVEKLSGKDGIDSLSRAKEKVSALAKNRFLLNQGLMERLVDAVEKFSTVENGWRWLEAAPPPACTAKSDFTYSPVSTAAEVEIFGLGESKRLSDCSFSWKVPHGGHFRLGVVALELENSQAVGASIFDIDCPFR